jgi:hypothetical protein
MCRLRGFGMVVEALAALAASGGNALVSAMVTDGWAGVKERFARLLGHGDPKATGDAAVRLEDSRAVLAGRSGADLERAEAEQEIAWRTRLADLLESHPEAEGELRAVVTEVQAQVIGSAVQVDQRVAGFGQAQQAVLGQGVQTNTFGGQDEPGARR